MFDAQLTPEEIRKFPFRGRGVKEFENSVCPLLPLIDARKGTNPLRILEIGCGYGQLLVELAVRYGEQVDLYGINLEPESINHDLMHRVARYRRTVPSDYFLPESTIHVSFGDAGTSLPFPEKHFDLILSQKAVIYIKDKGRAIEEVNRTLKEDGIGLLWTGFEFDNKEDGYWGSLEIHRGDILEGATEYFSNFSNLKYKMRPYGSTLEIRHENEMKLNLELVGCHDLSDIDERFFGIGSIYRHWDNR